MTTHQHGLHAVIITYQFTDNWIFLLSALILGIFPDIPRLFQKDTSDWTLYQELHTLKSPYIWIPFWNLHIYLDSFMHEKEGGWKPWVIYVEIFSNFAVLLYVYHLFY